MADTLTAKANTGSGTDALIVEQVGLAIMPVSKIHTGANRADSGPVTEKNPFPVRFGMKAGHDLAESVPLAPLPIAMAAGGCFCAKEDGTGSEIFYLTAAYGFYKYGVGSGNGVTKLATPSFNVGNTTAMRYMADQGFHGRVLAGTTSTTLKVGVPNGRMMDGRQLRILRGPGAGETKTLTWVSDTVHDAGACTSGTTNLLIADSSKSWRVNEHTGRIVALATGTGAVSYHRIISNDATTLKIWSGSMQDAWGSDLYSTSAPYDIPSYVSGVGQSTYQILSSTFTTDTAYTNTPNGYSWFTTVTGAIVLVSQASSSLTNYTAATYDVLNDMWSWRLGQSGIWPAAMTGDLSIERVGPLNTEYTSTGTVSGNTRTVADASAAWAIDELRNYRVEIVSGTGIGQSCRIVSNTATEITIDRQWPTAVPDSTSTFRVVPDGDSVYVASQGSAALAVMSLDGDVWANGKIADYGVVGSMAMWMPGDVGVAVSSGTRIASGIQAINPTPTAAGTGYKVNDVLTCAVGGTGAQVQVREITTAGAVVTLSLHHCGTGTGYATGTGKALTGGSGSGCTLEVTTVGPTCNVTVASTHVLRTGFFPWFAGLSDSAYNTWTQILAVPAYNVVCIATTAAANMAAAASQSSTVVIDASKSWTVNEHAGRTVAVIDTSGTAQYRRIASNTANALTLATALSGAATNGTARYVISESRVIGSELQYPTGQEPFGHATGGSTTTLQDTSKSWVGDCWAGYRFRIEAGTGLGAGLITVISNTKDTLTFSAQSFTPDASTRYDIEDTYGVPTTATSGNTPITEATRKKWRTNQFVGRLLRITSGSGVGAESIIVSNTATAITTNDYMTVDSSATYAIVGIPARGNGNALVCPWSASSKAARRSIVSPRGGGSNAVDSLAINIMTWQSAPTQSPNSETWDLGASFAYSGGDYVFAAKQGSAGDLINLLAMTASTRAVTTVATTAYGNGAPHNGCALVVTMPAADAVTPYLYVGSRSKKMMQRVQVLA